MSEVIELEKIVPGGQALGVLEDGKKCFVWGGLAGEKVEIEITKKKRSFVEGIVTKVIHPSKVRVEPRDEAFLSTSPWQIMRFEAELQTKAALVKEAFGQEKIELGEVEVATDGREWNYRNKMEFSFWWSNELERVQLAFYRRGTHGKMPITSESLTKAPIWEFANLILDEINRREIEARGLKTLMVRCSNDGAVTGQLYVMDLEFGDLEIEGLETIYSDPRCPASVATKKLFGGTRILSDEILGKRYNYAVDGFFQVNLPVYELALEDMTKFVGAGKIVDLYSGVGTVGLSVVRDRDLTLVEVSEAAVEEARKNAEGTDAKVILAKSEDALEQIDGARTVIVDPPRAGLHKKVVEKLLEVLPEKIIYLSCNPTTQARDVKMLLDGYEIEFVKGYNFFPKTPHVENLIILKRLA